MNNIPAVKMGIISVSRGCFPISLSERRRHAIANAYDGELYDCPVTVETEADVKKAIEDVKANGVNALCVYLGNFGPETPETMLAQYFDGPVMYVAAAEGDGDMINGRGDAYCGMLNCSYNLGLRNIKAFIPPYPVGTASDIAKMIAEFVPVATALLGLRSLKIITFGPRPSDFFACNAPIKPLFDLGVEVEENSELDLLVSYRAHANDERIPALMAEMAAELGENNPYKGVLPRLAQYELTLLDWAEEHKGTRDYVAFANKCWPAFQTEFGFVPCYVNSRLTERGIPVSCEVDIFGALSEYIGICVTGESVTLLDINNSVPASIYDEDIKGRYDFRLDETFMGLPLRQYTGMPFEKPAYGLPAHHETSARTGKSRAGYHPRHHGRRHRCKRYHVLPSAGHCFGRTESIYRTGSDTRRRIPQLRQHRRVCNSGNGSFLPLCARRETVSAPRCSCILALRQSTVLAVQLLGHCGHRI